MGAAVVLNELHSRRGDVDSGHGTSRQCSAVSRATDLKETADVARPQAGV